jgi:hypothetical protein
MGNKERCGTTNEFGELLAETAPRRRIKRGERLIK